jgi:hypothetical protein
MRGKGRNLRKDYSIWKRSYEYFFRTNLCEHICQKQINDIKRGPLYSKTWDNYNRIYYNIHE